MLQKTIVLCMNEMSELKGEGPALMKKWASSPWETNPVRVPVLAPTMAEPALLAQEMVVKRRPEARSPSATMLMKVERGTTALR